MTYSDADLLDALAEFADGHDGRPPTVPEANDRADLPSATAYITHFGTWNAAVAAAGLTPRARRRTDEELLADLRTVADAGEHPTVVAVADHEGMADPATYRNRFGTWNNALDAAGLPSFSRDAPDRE